MLSRPDPVGDGLSLLSLLVQVLNTFMTAYIHEKRSLARLICSPTIDY